jgi:DNA-binding NtrC family response regulator
LKQKSVQGIDPEALSLLMAHDWPGNIRELENAIERAFVLCRSGHIGIAQLPVELTAHRCGRDTQADVGSALMGFRFFPLWLETWTR